jgi:hypothetical protein
MLTEADLEIADTILMAAYHTSSSRKIELQRYLALQGVSSFMAELPVDRDGLVLEYPGLFRRIGTW